MLAIAPFGAIAPDGIREHPWRNRSVLSRAYHTRGADVPLVRFNRVHDGEESGIWVWDGASPLPEVNEIWANAIAEITISGAGSDPLVRANRVHDGNYRGIRVSDGASPSSRNSSRISAIARWSARP